MNINKEICKKCCCKKGCFGQIISEKSFENIWEFHRVDKSKGKKGNCPLFFIWDDNGLKNGFPDFCNYKMELIING